MLEKAIDGVGKVSVVAIPVSEAVEKTGLVISADTYQFIASCGVAILIIDKLIRLTWTQIDRIKARRSLK